MIFFAHIYEMTKKLSPAQLHSHSPVMMHRLDTITSIALIPYISFAFRHKLNVADVLELALVVFIEARMLLSATGFIPLTSVEASTTGAAVCITLLVLINVLAIFVPYFRRSVF